MDLWIFRHGWLGCKRDQRSTAMWFKVSPSKTTTGVSPSKTKPCLNEAVPAWTGPFELFCRAHWKQVAGVVV